MGEPTIYCQKCGMMIPASDFAQDKAGTIAGINYCAKCKPVMPEAERKIFSCVSCRAQYNVAKLKPGTKFKCQKCGAVNIVPSQPEVSVGTLSARVPSRQPPRPSTRSTRFGRPAVSSITARASAKTVIPGRRVGTARRKPVSRSYLMIGAVALVALIVGLIMLLRHQADATATQEWIELAGKAYKEIIQYGRDHPLDYEKILQKIENTRGQVERTRYQALLERMAPEIQAKLEVLNKADGVKEKLDKATEPKDYAGAIKQYSRLKKDAQESEDSEELITELEQRIKKVRQALKVQKTEVNDALGNLELGVEIGLRQYDFEKAQEAIEKFPERLRTLEVVAKLEEFKEKIKKLEEEYVKERNLTMGPWRKRGNANCTATPQGKNMVLENKNIWNPDKPKAHLGYFVVGELTWREYIADIEFKVPQGSADVIVRAGADFFKTKPKPAALVQLPRIPGVNTWSTLHLELKDNQISYAGTVSETEVKKTVPVPAVVSSQGGIGFQLKPGTKVIVKKLTVRAVQ